MASMKAWKHCMSNKVDFFSGHFRALNQNFLLALLHEITE